MVTHYPFKWMRAGMNVPCPTARIMLWGAFFSGVLVYCLFAGFLSTELPFAGSRLDAKL
jgi:hypothetical protein